METTVNLDRIRPERLAGYATNYLGEPRERRYAIGRCGPRST
jgi:hypothetical protein